MSNAANGQPLSVLLAGKLVDGRYQLGPTMGWGGLSDVYYARDRVTGDAVAIKMLPGMDTAEIGEAVGEAEELAMLHDPGIVRLRARGVRDGTPYLVVDLVEGPSLAELLQRGPLAEEDVVAMGATIARTLGHAHAIGAVHRALHPGNIVFTPVGEPKLTDFGLVLTADPTAVVGGHSLAGLQGHLAPEQVQGEAAEAPADIYSLGLVLIEAITGARPFSGTPAEAATTRLVQQPLVPATISPWLAEVLEAMTAIDPGSRPNASTVAAALAERSADALAAPVDEPEVESIDLRDHVEPAIALAPPTVAIQPPSTSERRAAAADVVIAVIAVALLVIFTLVVF